MEDAPLGHGWFGAGDSKSWSISIESKLFIEMTGCPSISLLLFASKMKKVERGRPPLMMKPGRSLSKEGGR
jgi:hypothetical protein